MILEIIGGFIGLIIVLAICIGFFKITFGVFFWLFCFVAQNIFALAIFIFCCYFFITCLI